MKHFASPAFWKTCGALTFLFFHALAAGDDPFRFDGAKILQDDEHLGIANGRTTCGLNKEQAGGLHGVWAPPFVASDFRASIYIVDEPLKVMSSAWWPDAFYWKASGADHDLECRVDLVPGERALLLRGICTPRGDAKPGRLVCAMQGTIDRAARWEFARVEGKRRSVNVMDAPPAIALCSGDDAIAINANSLELQLPEGSMAGMLNYVAKVDRPVTFRIAIALGPQEDATVLAAKLLAQPADPDFTAHTTLTPLAFPRFTSDNPALDALYKRSLVHLIMNRWDVPEFVLRPYYSTGSVGGGCVCNYLWNFGLVWEILPLLDPAAARSHIKHFLECDITKHFAFDPQSGTPFGPWYMVNQEKIVGLIYFYTLITGDRAFLDKVVDGKSIGEWAVWHALYGDDLNKPVALIDYGPSNSHLELRRQYQYNHVMPDLNGRRYATYERAEAIARWMGAPRPELLDRAAQLKVVLEKELWDPQARWFSFLGEGGKRENRYTLQLFKLLGSGVLSETTQQGLLSHLNEDEFLSPYGFHSMSKKDPAYDQVDIDNGGGGSCTGFPPQIAERMYKAGLDAPADDLLRRILWWGERMPYWGDSIVANEIAYRNNTPLQCTIDGAAVAQCVVFGLLGIQPRDDGGIVINPRKTTLYAKARLSGLKLLGKTFDLDIEGDSFTVTTPGATQLGKIGKAIRLK